MRTDEYGGPLENRARLPVAIINAVRDESFSWRLARLPA
ncbi:oxidoreductase [Sphingomonas sp. KC8]